MAEEASVLEQEPEAQTEEKSPLEAFEEYLSGQPEAPEAEKTEQPSGEEDAAETTAGESTEAAESQETPAEPETPPEEPLVKLELPEDEYGPDDPIRKQFQSIVDKLNAEHASRVKAESELKAAKERQEQREFSEQFNALYQTFDDTLDSYDSPKYGNAKKGLTVAQHAARKAVADRYQGLGAEVSTPVEEKRRLAELALSAYDPGVVQQHHQKQQQSRQPPKRVTGGGHARDVRLAPTIKDLTDRWEEALRKGDTALLTE
jgi:hypothetical protein